MAWQFHNNTPIYLQLTEKLKLQILTGEYPLGSKIPSVRDLALETGVNPNTMQRALAELERQNLLCSQRTIGKFITEDQNMINQMQTQIAQEEIKQFLFKMEQLGLVKQDVLKMIEVATQGGKE